MKGVKSVENTTNFSTVQLSARNTSDLTLGNNANSADVNTETVYRKSNLHYMALNG